MSLLIVIDGVDASGKETQSELLASRFIKMNKKVRRISFPCYEKPWSSPVKMYLSGEFGEKPDDVNAYTASALFAVDRFASYKTDWKKDYDDNTVIIADRYVSSNMIHQAGKINNPDEKTTFLKWLDDFEYNKIGIPRPDAVIFLDMPVEYGMQLMKKRNNKIDGSKSLDIHEGNAAYLQKSYENAVSISKAFGWTRIECVHDGKIRSIDDINNEIFARIEHLTD